MSRRAWGLAAAALLLGWPQQASARRRIGPLLVPSDRDKEEEPAREDSPEARKLDELRDQLAQQMKEMEPLEGKLNAEVAALNEHRDLEQLFAERDALLLDVKVKLEKLSTLEDQFNLLKKEHENASLLAGWQEILGGKIPRDAGSKFNAAMDRAHFASRVHKFRTDLMILMSTEETAFKAAKSALETRQLLIRSGLGALALLLVLGWVAVKRWGRPQWITAEAETATGLPPPAMRSLAGPAAPGPDITGSVLGGHYKIERRIGQGGMGVVYEATDLTLKRKVAIKRMRAELCESPSDLEQFMHEAQTVATLKHPNIVEIYSIYKLDGMAYLVFEYVAGRTLQQALAAGKRISLRSARNVLRQLGAALDYAHGRKVIHRDIKPSNIIISTEGSAKIMDFGIAHQAKLTAAKLTRVESLGTPPYMAPEQELGTVSRESDLYALGVCFYEMVTGKLPFSGPNFLAQKQRLLYTPPTKAAKDLPPGLDEIVGKVFSLEPGQRYHSGAELAAALDALPDVQARAS